MSSSSLSSSSFSSLNVNSQTQIIFKAPVWKLMHHPENNVVYCKHCDFKIDFNTYGSNGKITTVPLNRHCETKHTKEWLEVTLKNYSTDFQNDLPWN
jgi:hypothetical protein